MTEGEDFWVSESAVRTLTKATSDIHAIVETIERIENTFPLDLLSVYKNLEESTSDLRRLIADVKIIRGDGGEEGLRVPAEVENAIASATFLIGRIDVLAIQLKSTSFKQLNLFHKKLLKQAREARDLLEKIAVQDSEDEVKMENEEPTIKMDSPKTDQNMNSNFNDDEEDTSFSHQKQVGSEDESKKIQLVTRGKNCRKLSEGTPKAPILLTSEDEEVEEESSSNDDQSDDDWCLPSASKRRSHK